MILKVLIRIVQLFPPGPIMKTNGSAEEDAVEENEDGGGRSLRSKGKRSLDA